MADSNVKEHRETANDLHRWLHSVLDTAELHANLATTQSEKITQQQEIIANLEAKILQLSRDLENQNGQTIGLCRKCRRRT